MAYSDFKSFIQANYKDMLIEEISNFVNEKHDAHGFHSVNVLSLCEQKIDNFEIKNMVCHDDIGPYITIDINCTADIVTMGLGKTQYEAGRKTRWFTIYMRARLQEGLHEVCILRVEEYEPGEFKKEGALDEFLIPYIYADDLETVAEDFLNFYYTEDVIFDRFVFPYKHIMEEMGIQYYYSNKLPENEFGRMYFKKASLPVYIELGVGHPKYRKIELAEKELVPGTMVINENTYFMQNYGSGLHTIAHEIIHWELHQKFFQVLSLLNQDAENMTCEVVPEDYSDDMTPIQKAIWWAEWQANALAPRILMPARIFLYLFERILLEQSQRHCFRVIGEIVEETLEVLSNLFNVSKFAVKNRALQLGLTCVDGSLLYVDNRYFPPLYYERGSIGKNQTFVIDRKSARAVLKENSNLSTLVDSGAFVYTGHVFVINDLKYVKRTNDPISPRGYELTKYGTDHADECCLIFERRYGKNDKSHDGNLYQLCYLSQEVSSKYYIEAVYDKDYSCNQKTVERAQEITKIKEQMELRRLILKETAGMEFYECLAYHMKRRNITEEALAERSGLSVRSIGEYHRRAKNIQLTTVLAICIGLNLRKEFCYDLIKKAGYTLGMSDDHQVYKELIEYHTDGNLNEWNQILDDFEIDQRLPNNR